MKRLAAVCSLFLPLFCAWQGALAQAREAAPAKPPVRHLIIISIDSLMPEAYLHPDAHGLKIPNLREIVRNGAYSTGARTVMPALTYPAHTSLVTGVNPGTHGIINNRIDDPKGSGAEYLRWYTEDIRVPTLYQVAKAKGLRVGLIYWPVTVGAKVDAIVPEFWRGEDGNLEDRKLSRAMSTPGLLDAVVKRFPDFYNGFAPPRVEDPPSASVAVYLLETLKPHLLLLHMFEVDHRTHNEGIFSEKAKEAIEIADAQIGRVIDAAKRAGTWSSTILAIVSDHGMDPYQRRVRPGVWLKDAGLVTLDKSNKVTESKVWVTTMSGSAYIYINDENDANTKQQLLTLFRERMAGPNARVARIFSREEIKTMGGDGRAFLAIEAPDGIDYSWGYSGDVEYGNYTNRAHHGHSPDVPAMNSSMLFYGPSIAPGVIEGARIIDFAPTVAPWLGLKMEKSEGHALPVPRHPQQKPATARLR